MCIIARKKEGLPLDDQSWKWLKNSFDNNADGAGFMYRLGNGKVRVFKGFMTWDDFKDAVIDKIETINKKEVVFHFRIGTSGANSQAMCHPFPICRNDSKLGQTKLKCDAALVHNGIISGYGDKNFSDTHVFVRDVLTQLPYKSEAIRSLMANSLHSKFIIMDAGTTYFMGEFEEEEGWMFSNNSYKREPYTKATSQYTYYGKKNDDEFQFPSTYSRWADEYEQHLYEKSKEDKLALPIYDRLTDTYVEPILCPSCEYACLPHEIEELDMEGCTGPDGEPIYMCEYCVDFYRGAGIEVFAQDMDNGTLNLTYQGVR